jgi:Protein of unknown function (DUF3006)
MMKAAIDRFEGKFAVLIVGEDEQRISVLRKLLPKESKEGSWLQVEIQNGEVVRAEMDEEETERAKQRIAEKLARLRRGDHLGK